MRIAEALGISWQAVSRWEVGTATPTLDNLLILSRLYDVPLDEFVQKEIGEPVEAPTDAPEEASTDVTAVPSALTRAGKSYTTSVCAFLAVLIPGVGILIGVSVQLKLEPGDQSVSNTTGKNGVSLFDAANDLTTIFTPQGSYTYSASPEVDPGFSTDIEIWIIEEEELQKITEEIAAEREDTKKNAPPRAKLFDEDVRELAEQYDPIAMTREQYDSILETLVDKGVLTREEISYMGYKGITAIDSATLHEAMVIPLNDPMDQASRDLLWSNYSTGAPYGGTRFNNANGTYEVILSRLVGTNSTRILRSKQHHSWSDGIAVA